MKTFAKVILISCLIGAIFLAGFLYWNNSMYKIKLYPSPQKKFKIAINDNLKLSGKNVQLLENQDRGFRGETYLTLGSEEEFPSSKKSAYTRLNDQIVAYKDDNMQILQLYVYLIEYHDKALDALAFLQLTKYFKVLESKNLKVLLRFAYEYTSSDKRGPTTDQIEAHCKQLKGWFVTNKELVNKTVYAGQLGIIGLWGEGHGSYYSHNLTRVIKAVADMFPEEIYLMVRTPELLTAVPKELEKRFGLHDDFLVGIDHEWGMMSFKHIQYKSLLNKCNFAICDGEMPWGRDTTVPVIDEKLLTKQIVNYALTTLSIEHNYKEEKDKDFHLQKFKSVYLDEVFLKENNYPYNSKMLTEGKISVYEYYQYHLGYLLGVSNLKIEGNEVSFVLNNFGMAAPFEYQAYVIANGKRIDVASSLSDLRKFGQKTISIKIENIKSLSLVVKHRRSGDVVKLCNDLPFESNGETKII